MCAGGSIGGLFTAAALRRAGWTVEVLERTGVPLAGRGAGIVTHPELVAALKAVGADTCALGVDVHERVTYGRDGERVSSLAFHQVVTSWDRMYTLLRATVPDGAYRLGQEVTGYAQTDTAAAVLLADGTRREADLVVGADGFRSAIRAQMQPEIQPAYSGYVVWRTVASEQDLPAEIRADIFQTFGFFLPNDAQVVGYPIAGPGNDLTPGNLRYNFVWYAQVPEAELAQMRTDASGRHHPISIPPPLVRDEVITQAMETAARDLPPPFVEILNVSERPFFTPIYDHLSPVMGAGRVALAGDAASVARPHVGMGVTKAAGDALALARHLGQAPVPEALAAYSAERVAACRIAYDTAQRLGSYIFSANPATNRDGRSHAHMAAIMRDTAIVPPALQDPRIRE